MRCTASPIIKCRNKVFVNPESIPSLPILSPASDKRMFKIQIASIIEPSDQAKLFNDLSVQYFPFVFLHVIELLPLLNQSVQPFIHSLQLVLHTTKDRPAQECRPIITMHLAALQWTATSARAAKLTASISLIIK